MTSMEEGNDYGSIPISTAKTLVKLDEFKVAGLDIEFYYLDNGVKSSMQWVLKNFEDSDYYDGTDESVVKLNYVALKYLTNEGVIDMWNLFINNPKAQKWMVSLIIVWAACHEIVGLHCHSKTSSSIKIE